jgi:hypothetical protein
MCGEQSRWPAKRCENGEAHGQSVAISYSTKGQKRQASVQEFVHGQKRHRRPGGREEEEPRHQEVNSIQVKDTTFTKLCEHPSI